MTMGPKTRRIAALERDKAELQEQLGELTEQLARAEARASSREQLAARDALIARLRDALEKFGEHPNFCRAFPALTEEHIRTYCDCGLFDALKDDAQPATDR